MQEEKQRSWNINIRARSKNFDFKLKGASILPSWKFHQLSILLRLHKFRLKVNSESGTPFPRQQPRTLKSKIFMISKKFKTRQAKKKTLNLPYPETKSPVNRWKQFPYEEPMCIGSLVTGILAFLSKSISEKDQKEIIVHGSVILLCVAIWFQKYRTGKSSTLLKYLMAATVVCSVVLHFGYYVNYDQGYVLKLVWKAWNYAVSSGCLYALSKVIFERVCQSVGVQLGAK